MFVTIKMLHGLVTQKKCCHNYLQPIIAVKRTKVAFISEGIKEFAKNVVLQYLFTELNINFWTNVHKCLFYLYFNYFI